jgi:cytochrome o ubiquinol oxidase subunit II
LVGLAVLIPVLLNGTNIAVFNPKGIVADEQTRLIVLIIFILFAVAIPTIGLLYFTAWKYRETNNKATHDPTAGRSRLINTATWGIPSVVMLICAIILWPVTHTLQPQKQIAGGATPLTIQVVAQRWKWVFIYPEQQIATVNYVHLPVDTPVLFELTADEAPMSAFWIPNLGGMLYAMTGHVNRLNLLPETVGDYPGSTAEINGAGFAGMKFNVKVTSNDDFDAWVRSVQQENTVLNDAEYAKLVKPSENNVPTFYAAVDDGLYDKVLMKYAAGHNHETSKPEASEHEHEGRE